MNNNDHDMNDMAKTKVKAYQEIVMRFGFKKVMPQIDFQTAIHFWRVMKIS